MKRQAFFKKQNVAVGSITIVSAVFSLVSAVLGGTFGAGAGAVINHISENATLSIEVNPEGVIEPAHFPQKLKVAIYYFFDKDKVSNVEFYKYFESENISESDAIFAIRHSNAVVMKEFDDNGRQTYLPFDDVSEGERAILSASGDARKLVIAVPKGSPSMVSFDGQPDGELVWWHGRGRVF